MTVPRTMHAAYIRATGGTDRIEYGDLPTPQPGPTDVLVLLEASEANHVDLFVRSGAYATHTPFPFVIGRDIVGTVAAKGVGVAGFAESDRVWCNSLGHHGRQGAWSEYAVVPADRLHPLPKGVDAQEAAAVLHGAGTAHIGLVREARLAAGETLFIEGGGGAVGSAVIQMARAIGARVIASAGPEDAAWCQSLGADVVLDYHQKDLYARVRAAAPDGLDVWWDASGHNHFAECLPLLAMRARVIVMSGLRGTTPPALPVGAMYTREITLHGFAISNASVADMAAAATFINRLLAAGKLRARIGATYRLRDAAEAQQALESGSVRGRIVVLP